MILRFEDTNAGTERLEYYAAIKVGLDWLGIKYDSVEHVSDNLEVLYENAEKLIKSNDAYVCTCHRIPKGAMACLCRKYCLVFA